MNTSTSTQPDQQKEVVKTAEKSFEETEPDYFGECPICLKNNGCLHVGRDEWCVCHEHKFKWSIGSNLFSAWRHMTEEEFQKNWELLETYKKIEPIIRWKEWTDWHEAKKKAEAKSEAPEDRDRRNRRTFINLCLKFKRLREQRDDAFGFIESLQEDIRKNRPINGKINEFLDDRLKDLQGFDSGIDNDMETQELQRDCANEIYGCPF